MRAYRDPTADVAIAQVMAEEKMKKKMTECRGRASRLFFSLQRGGGHGKNVQSRK